MPSSDAIRIACPNCDAKILAPAHRLGKPAKCPGCQTVFTVTAPAPSKRTAPSETASTAGSGRSERLVDSSARPKSVMARRPVVEVEPEEEIAVDASHPDAQFDEPAKQAPKKKKKKKQSSGAFQVAGGFMVGAIASVVAGILGGVLWFGIAKAIGLEIGYLAWGIGACCGAAMSFGYQQNDAMAGVVAAASSILGILVGKVLIVKFIFLPEVLAALDKPGQIAAVKQNISILTLLPHTFGVLDAVFAFLAIATAFKIGAGMGK